MKFLFTLFSFFSLSFSFAQGGWSKKADFPTSSRNFGLCFTIGGKAYYGLGHKQSKPFVYKSYTDLWEYDPAKNTWTQLAAFPGPERIMAKGFCVNNKIYAGFGYLIAAYGADAGGHEYQTDCYMYDPMSNQWTKKNESTLGRGELFFTINDTLFSINLDYKLFSTYNATTDIWAISKLQKQENCPNHEYIKETTPSFSLANKGYIITYIRKKRKYINQLWEYNPHNVSWTLKNDLPGKGNDTLNCFSVGDKKYLLRGGRELFEYVAASDTWIEKKEIAPPNQKFSYLFTIGTKIYGFSKGEFWEYDFN